jgi:hypothetical protein
MLNYQRTRRSCTRIISSMDRLDWWRRILMSVIIYLELVLFIVKERRFSYECSCSDFNCNIIVAYDWRRWRRFLLLDARTYLTRSRRRWRQQRQSRRRRRRETNYILSFGRWFFRSDMIVDKYFIERQQPTEIFSSDCIFIRDKWRIFSSREIK